MTETITVRYAHTQAHMYLAERVHFSTVKKLLGIVRPRPY